jgi:uncharacterized phage-associated protein
MLQKNRTALPVAYYFLQRAASENEPITNLKLQKLVYYAAVWYFTLNDTRFFNDRIEAWIHGPAIPRVYGHFKEFGFNPIVVEGIETLKLPFDDGEKEFLENIWGIYGKYDAAYLEALTHSELPWQEARKDLDPGLPSKRTIDLQSAKSFYAARLEQSK